MLSEFCPDICSWTDISVALRCLRIGKIDFITYKYVINIYNNTIHSVICDFWHFTHMRKTFG